MAQTTSTAPASFASSNKKSNKKLWILVSAAVLVLILPILVLGWLGFIPGLSSLFGSNKQKDLGVRYSTVNVQTYQQRTGLTFADASLAPVNPNDPFQKQLLASPRQVDQIALSQEEVTAIINSMGWKWMPVKSIQVRISNNTVELSGVIDMEKIEEYTQQDSNASHDFENTLRWAKHLKNQTPVYVKAAGIIEDNVLTYTVLKAQVGRFSIPLSVLPNGASGTVRINSENFQAKKLRLTDGVLEFSGTYPTQIYLDR